MIGLDKHLTVPFRILLFINTILYNLHIIPNTLSHIFVVVAILCWSFEVSGSKKLRQQISHHRPAVGFTYGAYSTRLLIIADGYTVTETTWPLLCTYRICVP